jgi:Tfp pilus assembly protein PilX
MKGYIYAIVLGLLVVSALGNKLLYDAGKEKEREVKMLKAEVALREQEAKVNAEIGEKHAKAAEATRRLYADAQRKLENILAGVSAWSNISVPIVVVDGLRELVCKADSSNAACQPAARARITNTTEGNAEWGLDKVHCRPIGSYLDGEVGQAFIARIL